MRQSTIITAVSKISDRVRATNACLVMIYGRDLGKKYNLTVPELVIGRATKADIQIDHEAVSRNHCRLRNDGECIVLQDLGSTNGTFVNDEPISERVLVSGDFIKIGRVIFKFLGNDSIESDYHEEIYRLTTLDGLTQVFNRRYLMEILDREIGRAQRYQRKLSLIMFDIDHFKSINDNYGHLAGDYVLKHLASMVRGNIRREDILARYGGEEFVIVLPETDLDRAKQFAEKVRSIVEETTFTFDGEDIHVTVSVGIGTYADSFNDPIEFIGAADINMLEAKRQGRNCVVH